MNKRVVVVEGLVYIDGNTRLYSDEDLRQLEVILNLSRDLGVNLAGIEIILKGRDPRDAWAFAQRICGVCTLVHGMASIRAVEDALQWRVPANAQLIRNLRRVAGVNRVERERT